MRRPLAVAATACLMGGASYAAPPTASSERSPAAFKSGVAPEAPSEPTSEAADQADTLTKLGTSEFQRGELEEAKRDYERALRLVPGQSAATINLGLIAHRQKRFSDAEELLRGLIRRNPDAGLPWLVLGTIYYDQEKLDGALAALAQAAFLEPKDARTHHYLGLTLGKKGWYSAAEDETRKAIELQPSYAEAHFNLAIFYLQRTPPAIELARRHYQTALDLGAHRDPTIEKTLGK